jgi:hypothetical protein
MSCHCMSVMMIMMMIGFGLSGHVLTNIYGNSHPKEENNEYGLDERAMEGDDQVTKIKVDCRHDKKGGQYLSTLQYIPYLMLLLSMYHGFACYVTTTRVRYCCLSIDFLGTNSRNRVNDFLGTCSRNRVNDVVS